MVRYYNQFEKDQSEANISRLQSRNQWSCKGKLLNFYLCRDCHSRFKQQPYSVQDFEETTRLTIDVCDLCQRMNDKIRFDFKPVKQPRFD